MWSNKVLGVCVFFLLQCTLFGQNTVRDTTQNSGNTYFNITSLIVPATMAGYGITSLYSDELIRIDNNIRMDIRGENKIHLDDYLIYAPLTADIGMSIGGYESAHNYKDKALLYLMSTALNAFIVYPVKSLTTRLRPDDSDIRSFPSGHTSNAFVGAEFFWQEYKDRSVWLAASGYLAAAATGYLRVYNDKHWFSDVVTGAGLGILATKITYWIYPEIQRLFTAKNSALTVLPLINNDFTGLFIQYKISSNSYFSL